MKSRTTGRASVGLQRRAAHLAQRLGHVLFGKDAATGQPVEDGREAVG